MNYETFPVVGDITLDEAGRYHLWYRECHDQVWDAWTEVADLATYPSYQSRVYSAQRVGVQRLANTFYRSTDGVTWTSWPIYGLYNTIWTAHYAGRAYLVSYDDDLLRLSTDLGKTYTQRSVCPDYPDYTWTVKQTTMGGEIHALGTLSGDTARYYTYSTDLGLTWSAPVQCLPPTPVAWVGGTIYQTSARGYLAATVHADGDKRIAIAIEDWTEQKYVSVYNCGYRAYYPGPITYEDAYQRYTPMDILYATSDDGGATWGAVQRLKMDQNQTADGGATYAWGGASPAGGPGGMVYPPTGGFALNCCTYDGDLYAFYSCYEIYKRLGEPKECPLIGYCADIWEPVWPECVVVLKWEDWAGTPTLVDRIRIHDAGDAVAPDYWWFNEDMNLSDWRVGNSDDGQHALALAYSARPFYHQYSVWQYGATAYEQFRDGEKQLFSAPGFSFYVPDGLGGHAFWW